jgi:asparagine synthase (glutamine-hydrolysing)
MCGIAGIVGPKAERHDRALGRMLDVLEHRGPDGRGTYRFSDCLLGHTRLAVVDVALGDQPMLDAEGSVGITLNGQIYGFQEIRRGLDYPFRTHSDTEVVLALYERYGRELLTRLPGMFAFALWDDRRQELFAARDRFGERPFYWARGPEGELLFASEIGAILASGLVAPEIDPGALTHVLRRGYTHPSRPIYKNVHQLPPAHTLKFQGDEVRLERYWWMPEQRSGVGLAEAVEEFRDLFDRAVARQLVADVEVGALLSGGADSTTIATRARRRVPDLRTYTYGYAESSELPWAELVAAELGTRHVAIMEGEEDLASAVRRLPEIFDEPFCDSAAVPTWLLGRRVRHDLKVALTGEGADELLGGYSWWYLRPFRLSVDPASPDRVRFESPLALHRGLRARLTDEEIRRLGVEPIAWEEIEKERHWPETGGFEDVLRMDIDDFLAGDILVKTDRAAMAHGLELRAPFLDVDLASFCLGLPTELKMTTRTDKLILREAFSQQWPQAIRSREKQGFGAPMEAWMATDALSGLCQELLEDPRSAVFEALSFEGMRPLLDSPARRWRMLALALWFEARAN